ncbi:MAG: DUF2271 domain-containing protein [Spirochaetaceae bacterium]|nr:DUF2271 domain-containing protein [Spirochaetaceae bacterium]
MKVMNIAFGKSAAKVALLALATGLGAAASAQGAASPGAGAQAARAIEVEIEAGEGYAHTKWFGPLPMKLTPQVAVWIETDSGTYVDTVYVTEASAKNRWKGGAKIRRPEALPVWAHARGVKAADGLFMPDAATALPDAVSGATPKASFTKRLDFKAPLPAGRYRVRAEVNQSFDFNATWKDKLPAGDPRYNGVNGQPSLVYEGLLDLGSGQASVTLTPLGAGSATGSDGKSQAGLAGFDTALQILRSIRAKALK